MLYGMKFQRKSQKTGKKSVIGNYRTTINSEISKFTSSLTIHYKFMNKKCKVLL